MPRQGQIIPTALVPHVETYINDNTTFTDVAATPVDNGVRSIHVFASPKGEDGVLKAITSVQEYLEEYGTPNYELYGQPGYMPYAALSSGNAKCWCMRVMPETATYANAIIVANVKEDVEKVILVPAVAAVMDDDGNEITPAVQEVSVEVPTLKVKFTSTQIAAVAEEKNEDGSIKVEAKPGLTDRDAISAQLTELTNSDPVDNGYKQYPFFGVVAKGRGSYGNTLRLRVVTDQLSDTDNDYKNYTFEVLDSDGGLTKKETFTGAFLDTATVANVSIFAEDVINDFDTGSSKLEVVTNVNNLESIYAEYKDICERRNAAIKTAVESHNTTQTDDAKKITYVETQVTGYEQFDFINGINKDKTKITGYNIESVDGNSDINVIALERPDGIILGGGDDSTFSKTVVKATRDDSIDKEYIKAFSIDLNERGQYDNAILSKRRSPAEFIMDAGYSSQIKQAIAALALKRYDARCILDAGILNTTQQVIAWASEFSNIADRIISKEPQNIKVKDPFNGKTIPMTITYFLASALPTHYRVYGNQVPFVGSTYATLTGYVKNSIRPMIDADDIDTKELLYTNKLNFFECIAEDTFIRGVQGTSQKQWSDLSEENNVAVMLEMKRMLEDFVSNKLYNFAEPEDRVLFSQDADRLFADYRNRKVRSYRVYFDMNKFEEERSILHCYLELVFRTVAKRGIIEIDINKRV